MCVCVILLKTWQNCRSSRNGGERTPLFLKKSAHDSDKDQGDVICDFGPQKHYPSGLWDAYTV